MTNEEYDQKALDGLEEFERIVEKSILLWQQEDILSDEEWDERWDKLRDRHAIMCQKSDADYKTYKESRRIDK